MKLKDQILKSALKYLKWGWRVVPIPLKEKAPRLKNWQKLRLEKSDLVQYFGKHSNIGVLLGKPSGNLCDVDLDCPEAAFLAPHFLPETGRIHGRKSKPASHHWLRSASAVKAEKFNDPNGKCLLELRSTGQQTVVPPSVHPSGESIRWEKKGRAARVDATELRKCTAKLAAAVLFARHWPRKGNRHHAALALAGMLLRSGWTETGVAEFVYWIARAAGDEECRARKAVVRTTKKRLKRDSHATGRPRLAEIIGHQVVDRACEWLGIRHSNTSSVFVRSPEVTWPKPIAEPAFYGLAGTVVRAIEPITEADVAGLLVQFLIAFGNAAGRNAHFRVGATTHYPNLFGVLVGRTAKARKGTSWTEIERLFESADVVWAQRCLYPGGLSSGQGLIWAVRDPVEKRVKLKKGSHQDEGQTKIVEEGVEDKRLLVIETEFASPLRLMRLEGNILSAVIRRAWDKGNLGNLTKHSSDRATGAHISIIGHITSEELLREFSATEGSSGFGNRLLWICVRRSQLLPLGGRLAEEIFRSLVARLQDALSSARKMGEVRFTKQAEKLWCSVYPRLSREVPGLLGAMTMRAEAQVLRLATIYALLDRSRYVSRKHLRAGLAMWRYCERSAHYIFGDAFGDVVVDTILRQLRREPKGLTRTEIREIFSRNRSEKEINNALRVLLESRLARYVNEETGGRPAERWFAVTQGTP